MGCIRKPLGTARTERDTQARLRHNANRKRHPGTQRASLRVQRARSACLILFNRVAAVTSFIECYFGHSSRISFAVCTPHHRLARLGALCSLSIRELYTILCHPCKSGPFYAIPCQAMPIRANPCQSVPFRAKPPFQPPCQPQPPTSWHEIGSLQHEKLLKLGKTLPRPVSSNTSLRAKLQAPRITVVLEMGSTGCLQRER